MKTRLKAFFDLRVTAFAAGALFAVLTAKLCVGQNTPDVILSPGSRSLPSIDADRHVKAMKFETQQEFNAVMSALREHPQIAKDVTVVLDVPENSLLLQGDQDSVAQMNALLEEMMALQQVSGEIHREQANQKAESRVISEAMNKLLDLEATSIRLAAELRSSSVSGTRREDLEVKLRQVLNEIFDHQQAARHAEYTQFEARLIELKNRLVQRAEEREQIISERIDTLLSGKTDHTPMGAAGSFRKFDPTSFAGQLLNIGVLSKSSGSQCQISLIDPRTIVAGTILEISRPVKSNEQESFTRFGVLKVIGQINSDTISAELIESTRILKDNRWQWQLPQEGDRVMERHEQKNQ